MTDTTYPVHGAPGLPPDPDRDWLCESVRLIALSYAGAIVLALVACFATGDAPEPRTSSALLAELLVVALALWANRRGASARAAELLALSLPLLATALMILSGQGLRDVAALALPGSLILCGLLLDRRALITTTLLTIACATAVLLFEKQGLCVPLPPATGYFADAVDAAAILALTGLGVGRLALRLRTNHERLRAQESALRLSEARYRGLVDLAADGILLVDPSGAIVEANHRACELSGYSKEELAGPGLHVLFPSEGVDGRLCELDLLRRGQVVTAERRLTRKDGGALAVEVSARQMPDGLCQAIVRDVSARHRAEAERAALAEQLRQAQKLEAVGLLAGGVAHDFNNLLTAITGSVTLAMREPAGPGCSRRWLTEIDKAAWRAAALTRQLLAFSRQQLIAPRVVDLRAIVEASASLLERVVGEDVRLVTRLPEQPCRARVDQAQLEQVILNLAANARDAMPDGGTLTLRVGRGAADAASTQPAGRAGCETVFLSVTDTGHGMAAPVKDRVFEPFFTTKRGSGTGLGLAMVYGAVQQNGGWIELESQPGHGASYSVHFPRANEEPTLTPPPEPDAPLGTETILLVEDEEVVREVTADQLASLGYRVLRCASGEQALTIAAGHAGVLHLLVTDVVMPGMSGPELAGRLTAVRPGLRVVFTTGYGREAAARHGLLPDDQPLVEKPYARPILARAIRDALDA
jgi:two-component system cell cycle sensor histidine kinase/response regulator CckA